MFGFYLLIDSVRLTSFPIIFIVGGTVEGAVLKGAIVPAAADKEEGAVTGTPEAPVVDEEPPALSPAD